ncbi:hypothetical protein F5Y15DRAFT_62506 [Xylariaceae sp. FL0016]|nr:hypothetical protein F5Y15DRAFT_62506 [Xylariaceae sp. FL0016]
MSRNFAVSVQATMSQIDALNDSLVACVGVQQTPKQSIAINRHGRYPYSQESLATMNSSDLKAQTSVSSDDDPKLSDGCSKPEKCYVAASCEEIRPGFRRIMQIETCLNDTWLCELLWSFLAVGCLVAMCVILVTHQDAAQPDWPDWLSINTIVALLSDVIVSAILGVLSSGIGQAKWQWFSRPQPLDDMETFDKATRGTWGSLKLLFHHSTKGLLLAKSGCLVAVLTLAVGSFAQQIVHYYNCFQPSKTARASIPRSNNCSIGSIVFPGQAEFDPSVLATLYSGALNPPETDAAAIKSFTCPSGNCTFPTFSTLGMCHKCHEIPDLIRVNTTFSGYWLDNWVADPTWQWWREPARVGFTNVIPKAPYTMASSRKTLGFNPASGTSPFDDIATFDFLTLNLSPNCTVPIGEEEHCPKYPWAVRCSLYPCIKTFNTSIMKSVLTDTLLSYTPIRKSNISAIEVTTSTNLTWSHAVEKTLRQGRLTECSPSQTWTPENTIPITKNHTIQVIGNESVTWYPQDCVYVLEYPAALAINQYLSFIYDGAAVVSRSESTNDLYRENWVKVLYNKGRVNITGADAYFGGLAATITAIMREYGESAPAADVYGTVMELQTCIRIQWPWITFPIIIVLATIAFLILSIRNSSWRGTWKSSYLVPFFHGINGDVSAGSIGPTGSPSEMRLAAQRIHVQLDTSTDGLQVITQGHERDENAALRGENVKQMHSINTNRG